MSTYLDNLEKLADKMFARVDGWEINALRRIGSRVKKIGSLSYADLQAINNAVIVNQDVEAVMKELAELTGQNVREVQQMYNDMIATMHEDKKALYDYRNKPFVPFADNKDLQAITKAFARTTAETFVNFSMTKAQRIGFVDANGKFNPIDKAFKEVIDKAVMSVSTGTGDYNSEMLDVLRQLGGSGVRVDYGNDITRGLDSMVRQNVLWGAKQTAKEYEHIIGDELGCDGIEIDWHSNPRPSHEFMQGRQFILGEARTVNGIYFESADKALEALDDWGCLHFETRIICGVSEPAYSREELKRLNAENNRLIEIDGVSKKGYEWKQTMRRLEREGKETKLKRETFKAAGNNTEVRNQNMRLKAIEEKYQMIADKTGIKAQYERMAIVKEPKYAANVAIRNTHTSLEFNPDASFDVNLESFDPTVNKGLSDAAYKVAEMGGKTKREHLSLVDLNTGKEVYFESGDADSVGLRDFWKFVVENPDKSLAFIHNHNTDGYFSETDMVTLLYTENIKVMGAIRIDGVKYFAEKIETLKGTMHFDDLFEKQLKDLKLKTRNGIISSAEGTRLREEIIVDNALERFTRGLIEIDGRK